MGSCASRSGAMSESAAESSVHALTAKVVGLDGSMAQFAPPVTALEALAAIAAAGITASSPSPCFLCCSDELDFDAPVCALGPRDSLRPGQLYFALPVSMLERPLSAHDMAALAVKASAALGTAPVVATADGVPPSLDRSKSGADSSKQQRRRRRQTAGRRVAPLAVVSAHAHAHADGEWKRDDERKAESGDRTVGKARQGIVGQKGVARRVAVVQRLSAIAEAASE